MGSQYVGADSFPIDYTIPDDADPPTAAAVNVGLEALGDRTQWLRNRWAWFLTMPALNWRPKTFASAASTNCHVYASWDPILHRWIVGVQIGAADDKVFTSNDNGESWTQFGSDMTTGYDLVAVVADPVTSGKMHMAAVTISGTNNIEVWHSTGAGWSQDEVFDSSGSANKGLVEFIVYDGVLHAMTGNTTNNGRLWQLLSGTWTNKTAAYINTLSTVALYGLFPVVGGSTLLAFPRYIDAEGRYYRATNASTWSLITGMDASIVAGDTIRSAAYGKLADGSPCFIVAVKSATQSRFYRSTDDGLTFSQVSVINEATFNVESIQALDSLWVITGGTSGADERISVDGGVTWRVVSVGGLLASNNALANADRGSPLPRIYVHPTGFLVQNAKWIRVGYESGLP